MNPLVCKYIKAQIALAHHAKETRQWPLLRRLRTSIRELWQMRWWSSEKVSSYVRHLLGSSHTPSYLSGKATVH